MPVDLFDECKKVNSFANAFNGCTALTGEFSLYAGGGSKSSFIRTEY